MIQSAKMFHEKISNHPVIGDNIHYGYDRLLVIFLYAIAPFFGAIHHYAIFPIYLLATIASIRYIYAFPSILILKVVIFCALLFWHQDSFSSILNLASLAVADLYSLSVGLVFASLGLRRSSQILPFVSIFICVVGSFFSLGMREVGFDISNPFNLSEFNGRLLILAKSTAGHSVAIEAASLGLIFLLFSADISKWRFFLIFMMGGVLLLAASASSYLCFAAICGIAVFEFYDRGYAIRNFIHVLLVVMLLTLSVDVSLANEPMKFIRTVVVGQDLGNYLDGDYTSNRILLNSMMIMLANSAPWFGVGDGHEWFQLGTQALTGDRGATFEHTTVLAAKYGWPYFWIVIIISLIPIGCGLRSNGRARRILLALGYCILITNISNAGFSYAQSTLYMTFGPMIWLSWAQRGVKN